MTESRRSDLTNSTRLRPGTPAMTVLLAFMTAIGPLSMDIYLASVPHISEALNASTATVQLTLSLYLVGFAFAQLVYGPLSDGYGRRPLVIAGFGIYLLATCACAAATSIELLIVARILQAVGAAGPIILARAIVRDLYAGSRAARELGLMTTIMGVTPILAPVLGGFLQAWWGWRSGFIGMALIGVLLSACGLLFLPETNKRPARELSARDMFDSFRVVAAHRGYRSYVALVALCYIAVFAFLSGSSHVL